MGLAGIVNTTVYKTKPIFISWSWQIVLNFNTGLCLIIENWIIQGWPKHLRGKYMIWVTKSAILKFKCMDIWLNSHQFNIFPNHLLNGHDFAEDIFNSSTVKKSRTIISQILNTSWTAKSISQPPFLDKISVSGDTCNYTIRKMNKANLRDLIAATGLVILLKFDPNHRFFVPCDLEIWWMALENNRAPLLYYIKLCASFQIHRWIQIGITVRKR